MKEIFADRKRSTKNATPLSIIMESQTFQSCGYWLSERKGEGTGHAGNCCAGTRMRDAANRELKQRRRRRQRQRQKYNRFRACLHGGRGPQVGEVTRYRWSNPLVHIISHMIGGVTRHVLSHLSGVLHLHVNRLLDWKNNNFARASRFFVRFLAVVPRLQRESA